MKGRGPGGEPGRTSRRRPSAAVLAAVLAGGLYGVAASPLFTVQAVVVRGIDGPPAERITARLARIRGANLLAVREADVAAAAAEEPRVLQARLVRRLPAILEVRVVPREPVAQFPVGDRLWEVDRQGTVLGPAAAPGAYPTITGGTAPGEPLEPGRPGPPALADAAALAAALAGPLAGRLAGIDVDAAGERWLYLRDGSVIRWGAPDDGPQGEARRMRVLAALMQAVPAAQPFEADLRDPDRATWRPRGRGPGGG